MLKKSINNEMEKTFSHFGKTYSLATQKILIKITDNTFCIQLQIYALPTDQLKAFNILILFYS